MITIGSPASSTAPNTDVSQGPRSGLRNRTRRRPAGRPGGGRHVADARTPAGGDRPSNAIGAQLVRSRAERESPRLGRWPPGCSSSTTTRPSAMSSGGYLGDAGYGVDLAADGPGRVACRPRTRPRCRRARPDAARDERSGRVPGPAARGRAAADRHAHRAGRGGRPGAGTGARSRRLRDQAVQPARAGAAGRLGPAPRLAGRPGRRRTRRRTAAGRRGRPARRARRRRAGR